MDSTTKDLLVGAWYYKTTKLVLKIWLAFQSATVVDWNLSIGDLSNSSLDFLQNLTTLENNSEERKLKMEWKKKTSHKGR